MPRAVGGKPVTGYKSEPVTNSAGGYKSEQPVNTDSTGCYKSEPPVEHFPTLAELGIAQKRQLQRCLRFRRYTAINAAGTPRFKSAETNATSNYQDVS